VFVFTIDNRAICPTLRPIDGDTTSAVLVSGGEGRKFSTTAMVLRLVESKS